jgi:predicted ribosomally synthesized peptide with SipW-like signal peptide
MTRTGRLKAKNNEVKIKKRKAIKVLIPLFLLFFIGITATGTFAYFTDSEKILPAPVEGVPVYDEMIVSYTDHSESQIVNDGITIYFDVSNLLPGWNTPYFYYYVTTSGGSKLRENSWNSPTNDDKMRFDSIRTVNPTDLTKVNTQVNVNGTVTTYNNSLNGITWSGCWVKMKVIYSGFDITGTDVRYVIPHVGGDEAANNIKISAGVKEVYIKNAAVSAGGGPNLNWSKLEIKY